MSWTEPDPNHSLDDDARRGENLAGGSIVQEPFLLFGRELFVTASIGVAMSGSRWKRPDDLLRDADTAMYEAKEEATSGYRVFDPAMHERVLGRLGLENDIKRAMEAEEFDLHYQPIVDLGSGEAWGVEALIRWEHPQRGLLDPFEFVPLAEQNGILVPLEERALREACRRAQRWKEEQPRTRGLFLAVNLSASQLQSPDLAKTIGKTLRETGLEPCDLSLEITETMYIKVLERNIAVLDELKRLGVRISIDDFGVGYSSLSYLKRLPANILKIDKSFVKGIGRERDETAIVHMVIGLAHTLGMKVVAEGVESEEHVRLLKDMGCDLAQGFYFGEPLPPEEVPGFFTDRALRGLAGGDG